MYVHTKLFDHRDLITIQVGYWTLDNAANNGTFMEELEGLLHERDIDFDHMDRRIMCFPHVINICCQHVLAKFTNVNLIDIAGVTALPSSTSEQSFEEAVNSDPIARGRNVVRVLRSSGQRRDKFDEVVVDGNAKGWFVVGDEVVMLPNLQLLCDVRTRWDSVYFMIRRLRQMRPVSLYYLVLATTN